jgi:hypothetical protein
MKNVVSAITIAVAATLTTIATIIDDFFFDLLESVKKS